jgi:ribonuclease PH
LQADAGTRTTAITGGFVALKDALDSLVATGELVRSPLIHQVAAISVGVLDDNVLLDLNYQEDVAADLDFNVVMNERLDLIEIQGTAESGSFNRGQLNQILDLAEQGITELLESQHRVFQL